MVSSNPGHIDFGGMGFLCLAEHLRTAGHQVHWMAPPVHAGRLQQHGFAVIGNATMDALQAQLFYSMQRVRQHPAAFDKQLDYLRAVTAYVADWRPDVLLIDRILPLAGMLADHLGIPWLAMGTPGGNWQLSACGVEPTHQAVAAYQAVADCMTQRLGWDKAALPSLWACSPWLNVCFIGQAFYADSCPLGENSAFVHHFQPPPAASTGNSLGISFGNSGQPERMIDIMEGLLAGSTSLASIEVCTGHNTALRTQLARRYGKAIRLHGWVDFASLLPRLRILACFGGIGTIWACINHSLPMFIVPGGMGDQQYNGTMVERLQLGHCHNPAAGQAAASLTQLLLSEAQYRHNIQVFHQPSSASDNLSSVVRRIEKL